MIETTSVVFGYMNYSTEYKAGFVNNLFAQKLIPGTEKSTLNTDQLFNKYYFHDENISLAQLTGLQYYNHALDLLESNELIKASQQAEKGWFLYPSDRFKFLLVNLYAKLLQNDRLLKPMERAQLIAKLERYQGQGITIEMISGEYMKLSNQLLIRENNRPLLDECYHIITDKMKDQELWASVGFLYYYENGRVYYNQGRFLKAKFYFEEALKLQPNNVDLGRIFGDAIIQSRASMDEKHQLFDSLKYYVGKYPILSQFKNYNSLMASYMIRQFGIEYEAGHPDKAEKIRLQLEDMMKDQPLLDIDPMSIGQAYGTASSYYFRRGQKQKAKEYLDMGLKLSPDNYELRMRKSMIR